MPVVHPVPERERSGVVAVAAFVVGPSSAICCPIEEDNSLLKEEAPSAMSQSVKDPRTCGTRQENLHTIVIRFMNVNRFTPMLPPKKKSVETNQLMASLQCKLRMPTRDGKDCWNISPARRVYLLNILSEHLVGYIAVLKEGIELSQS
jgi:hypothetical protein